MNHESVLHFWFLCVEEELQRYLLACPKSLSNHTSSLTVSLESWRPFLASTMHECGSDAYIVLALQFRLGSS